jgi:acetyl esterase/lipase
MPEHEPHQRRRIPSLVVAIGGAILLVPAIAIGFAAPRSMSMLAPILASAELSPVLALLALVWLLLLQRLLAGRRRLRLGVSIALAAASAAALIPLARFAPVASRASAQLGAVPPRFSLTMALTGLPSAPDVRERVVRYAAGDGTPLSMRLFARDGRTGRHGTVVVLYGGAWRGGEPTQGANVSRALAQRGYTVVAIDYRHAPRFVFPAQLDDVRRSLALIRDSASAWRVDTTRIALLGRSAGGHLATLSAFSAGGPPVRAVIALYAPWDLVEGYHDLPRPDPIGVRTVIGNFVGGTPDQQPARYREASPASHVRSGLPATMLLFGSRDHLVKPEFNRAAASALRDAGVPVVELELPWAEHGFDLVPGGLGAQLAFAAIGSFLEREIGKGSDGAAPQRLAR